LGFLFFGASSAVFLSTILSTNDAALQQRLRAGLCIEAETSWLESDFPRHFSHDGGHLDEYLNDKHRSEWETVCEKVGANLYDQDVFVADGMTVLKRNVAKTVKWCGSLRGMLRLAFPSKRGPGAYSLPVCFLLRHVFVEIGIIAEREPWLLQEHPSFKKVLELCMGSQYAKRMRSIGRPTEDIFDQWLSLAMGSSDTVVAAFRELNLAMLHERESTVAIFGREPAMTLLKPSSRKWKDNRESFSERLEFLQRANSD